LHCRFEPRLEAPVRGSAVGVPVWQLRAMADRARKSSALLHRMLHPITHEFKFGRIANAAMKRKEHEHR
jgi:hypothetical protein